MVEQAHREDEILGVAHLDEKLDRIESLLERLIENGVSPAFAATPSTRTVIPGRASENHATKIADGASATEISPDDAFSNNVMMIAVSQALLTDIYSQTLPME